MRNPAYEKIKQAGALPSPTGVALEILRLTGDEGATIEAISAAIESDPAMAARLLKLVNSPLAGVARKIASVSSAVKLLGMRTVRSLALGFSLISNNRQGPCKGFDYETFWSDSLARAVTVRSVVRRLKNFATDEAFTVGLLSKIGRLALATAYPEAYAYALGLVEADLPGELVKIEQEVLEIDHNELSAEMLADWHLPEVFCDAVRHQDPTAPGVLEPGSRAEQLARILHLAGSLAPMMTHPKVYRDSLSHLVNQANRLGIKPDVFPELFDSVGHEWREAGAILSVTTRSVPSLAEIYAQAHARRDALGEPQTRPTPDEAAAHARS